MALQEPQLEPVEAEALGLLSLLNMPKVENCFMTLLLLHLGQQMLLSSAAPRMNSSNRFAHFLHLYSNIGMTVLYNEYYHIWSCLRRVFL